MVLAQVTEIFVQFFDALFVRLDAFALEAFVELLGFEQCWLANDP